MTAATNPLFLAHYLICVNIFMRFQAPLLHYRTRAQPQPPPDWLPLCFQWQRIFFASMDTASCWLRPPSQWRRSAGLCLSDSAPGLRSTRPPRPVPGCQHAMAQWGGSKQPRGPGRGLGRARVDASAGRGSGGSQSCVLLPLQPLEPSLGSVLVPGPSLSPAGAKNTTAQL